MSSYFAIKDDKRPVALSPQYLVDCGREFSSKLNGCSGSRDMGAVFEFLKQKDIPLEDNYPYLGTESMCKSP